VDSVPDWKLDFRGAARVIMVDAVWNGDDGTWEATSADLPDLNVTAPTYSALLDRLQTDAVDHTRRLVHKTLCDIVIDVVRNRSMTVH
jgi:hypothetical protein